MDFKIGSSQVGMPTQYGGVRGYYSGYGMKPGFVSIMLTYYPK